MTHQKILENCRFCSIPEPERVIARTDNCFAMLSLGPFVDGYTLVLTKEHVSCCGSISPKVLSDFESLVKSVMRVQVARFGASIFYEHGRAGSCITTDGSEFHCHHAHLHVVPILGDFRNDLKSIFEYKDFRTWRDFIEWYQRTESPYLLVGDNEELTCLIVERKIERQFLRRVAANSVGSSHLADWQKHPDRDRIAPLVDEISRDLTLELNALKEVEE